MSMILQNLRSVTPGVTPSELSPGQLCFNLVDEVMFVGDGSNLYTQFDGTQSPAPPGGGWFSMPLSLGNLSRYLLLNPEYYGPPPSNNQVISYSSSLGKPVWSSIPTSGGNSVYTTTNSAVSSAPGSTVSEKISSATGATPVEADSAIVAGSPGDLYQGLYLFHSGTWTFAAGYADPLAAQVPYNNAISGILSTTVQSAIDEVVAGKINIATNAPFNGAVLSWNSGNTEWVNQSTSYPTAAQVSFDPSGTGLPPSANTVQEALTSTWTLASNAQSAATQAAASAATAQNVANSAFTLANAALPLTGGTMTGDISFNNGQPVDAGSF